MLQSISNLSRNKQNVGALNYKICNNTANKTNKINTISDSYNFSNQMSQIAFEGNSTKAGRNILSKATKKLSTKIKIFATESADVISETVKKTGAKNELPIVKKPIIAPYDQPDESALKAAAHLLEQSDKLVSSAHKTAIRAAVNWAEKMKSTATGNYSSGGLGAIKDANSNALEAAKDINPNFKGFLGDNIDTLHEHIADNVDIIHEHVVNNADIIHEHVTNNIDTIVENAGKIAQAIIDFFT